MYELIYVVNGLSQFTYNGWYINYKNVHSINNTKFVKIYYLFLKAQWDEQCETNTLPK